MSCLLDDLTITVPALAEGEFPQRALCSPTTNLYALLTFVASSLGAVSFSGSRFSSLSLLARLRKRSAVLLLNVVCHRLNRMPGTENFCYRPSLCWATTGGKRGVPVKYFTSAAKSMGLHMIDKGR